MKGILRGAFFLSLVILLSFWSVAPLFHEGFFPMHDDTQVSRVYEMAKAISYGQFPVRWVGDLGYGYGYPLFNFYAPLPYYIGAIFNLLGFDALMATKIMFVIGITLSGITMFFLLNSFTSSLGALVGSILYMYAPYHAVDIYVRGAVGEFYALAFLPLLGFGIHKIIATHLTSKTKYELKKAILFGTAGFAGVLLSHNILGMVTAEFLIFGILVYLIYQISHKKNLMKSYLLLLIFLLGIGISSFFVLPAFLEKDFTRVNELTFGSNNFNNHFVYLDQLWNSPWGYAGSAPGRADGMSFMIGKIHLLLALIGVPAIFILYKHRKINTFQLSVFSFQLILFLASIFLMLEQSKFIWDLLPGFSFIQYPWRFLIFAMFSLSIMVSILILALNRVARIFIAVFLIILIIWFNSKYFSPQTYLFVNDWNYTNTRAINYEISKISDEYLPKDFSIPRGESEIAFHGMIDTIYVSVNEIIKETPTQKIYNVFAKEQTKTVTRIAFFPGWRGYIDGSEVTITSSKGRIVIDLPPGRHTVEYRLTDTPIRTYSNAISILTLFLVVYIIVFLKAQL